VNSTKADELAMRLEEAIVSGAIPPGSILRQEKIAEQFSVSRTPVREALRRLSAFGLVSFTPNRGVQVRELSKAAFHEQFMIRAVLEAAAAERAATLIDEQQLNELRRHEDEFARLTHELRASAHGTDHREAATVAWVQANDRFHDVILKAAQAPMLEEMARGVRRVFLGLASWTAGTAIDQLFEDNLCQHRAIVEALAARSSSASGALVREHLIASGELLETLLDAVRASP
jgi:DNA-binding GntR family transcriptional regulator